MRIASTVTILQLDSPTVPARRPIRKKIFGAILGVPFRPGVDNQALTATPFFQCISKLLMRSYLR